YRSSDSRRRRTAPSAGCWARCWAGSSPRRGAGSRWKAVGAPRRSADPDVRWIDLPPEYVGLLCLNTAAEGGVSRFVSLTDAHSSLQGTAPGLLKRLYQPFPWDRQAEHAPDDDKVDWQPIFADGPGGVVCRYNRVLIESGASPVGQPVDAAGLAAGGAGRGRGGGGARRSGRAVSR